MGFFGDPLRNLSYFRPEARTSSELRLLGWNVPPHELQYIPDHWLKYPEPPESLNYLLGILYVFFFIMSIAGNGVVIYVFCAAKSLRTPSNILVINLAICDFFMMSKTPVFIYNSFNRGFALGNMGCQIYSVIGAYTGIGASLTNAFIAYDRFNVITRPMEGKMTQVKAVIMVIFIYLYATPFVLLPATQFWGRFVPGIGLTSFLKVHLCRDAIEVPSEIAYWVATLNQSVRFKLPRINSESNDTLILYASRRGVEMIAHLK